MAPSIAKLSDNHDDKQWYKVLHEVEYAINNTINRSTGKSQIVFGFDQRGSCEDNLKSRVESTINPPTRDLQDIRKQATACINQSQHQQKADYDKKRKAPKRYEKGWLW